MCGIFGCVGVKKPVAVAIKGLERLEYRGYDSAGITTFQKGKIVTLKRVGKISVLEKALEEKKLEGENVALAHTRWATHGQPTEKNAHPHMDTKGTLALVHNGIIENHDILRKALADKNIQYVSDTDTEVLAHLIANLYDGDILEAVQRALPLIEGSYAVGLLHESDPHSIVAFAKDAPLAIGVGEGCCYLSSDPNAFPEEVKRVLFLSKGEIARLGPGKLELYDIDLVPLKKEMMVLENTTQASSKGDYTHYTLKEIDEQPMTIRKALYNRTLLDWGTVKLEGINLSVHELLAVERVLILGCGTSYNAGMIGSAMIEELARIPSQTEIASEYRYSNPIVQSGTLVIAISQSGETADTVAAVRELKAKGAPVVAICNVHGSTLAREANGNLFLNAGPEIGVCSTKAFTSQVVVLALFALMMGRMRNISREEGQEFLEHLIRLPQDVEAVLEKRGEIQALAKKYAHYDNFFFLGRRYMYPISMEGALKLKEISYINANGYPAGEMKHGPIALINPECPTVAFTTNKKTFGKMISNLREVKARNGKVIAIASVPKEELIDVADDVIIIPDTIDPLATIPAAVAAQLFAYYVALERKQEIDQPRNLAKSVTVE